MYTAAGIDVSKVSHATRRAAALNADIAGVPEAEVGIPTLLVSASDRVSYWYLLSYSRRHKRSAFLPTF